MGPIFHKNIHNMGPYLWLRQNCQVLTCEHQKIVKNGPIFLEKCLKINVPFFGSLLITAVFGWTIRWGTSRLVSVWSSCAGRGRYWCYAICIHLEGHCPKISSSSTSQLQESKWFVKKEGNPNKSLFFLFCFFLKQDIMTILPNGGLSFSSKYRVMKRLEGSQIFEWKIGVTKIMKKWLGGQNFTENFVQWNRLTEIKQKLR